MTGLIPLCAAAIGNPAADPAPHRVPRARDRVPGTRGPSTHRRCASARRAPHDAGARGRRPACRAPRTWLDEDEFLSPHGIRALSAAYRERPYSSPRPAPNGRRLRAGRVDHRPVRRNSNWRGPIWFPVNYLVIEALRRFSQGLTTTSPSSSRPGRETRTRCGRSRRPRGAPGRDLPPGGRQRPVFGGTSSGPTRVARRLLFYEYFHGDTAPASARRTRPAGPAWSPTS